MRKRIGIIGGAGYQSTLEYYSRIMNKYSAQFGDMDYPEVVIYSLSHGKFKGYEDNRQMDEYVDYISKAIFALEKARVDFITLAANSPHSVMDRLRELTRTPFISALDSAYNESARLGYKKLLLMGIKYTMQSDYFQKRFSKGGIEVVAPSPEDQTKIHSVIYDELMKGIIQESSKINLYTIIEKYPVDAVLLGCMKLPIILKNGESKYKFVDTLDLHTTDILNATVEAQ